MTSLWFEHQSLRIAALTAVGVAYCLSTHTAEAPVTTSAAPFEWSNPLRFNGTGDYNSLRDPCIVSDVSADGDASYYLVHTMFPFSGCDKAPCTGSPGIFMWSSLDLVHWSPYKWLLQATTLPVDAPYNGRFWAPEIHAIRGKWYLIFTGDNFQNASWAPNGKNGLWAFLGVAASVDGPYENITFIPGAACDTTLFWDESSDRVWALMPFQDIYQQEIVLDAGPTFGNLMGPRVMVMNHSMADIGQPTPLYLEGPFAVKGASSGSASSAVILFAAANYNSTEYPGMGYETAVAYTSDVASFNYTKDPAGAVFWGGHLAVFPGPCGLQWFAYREEEWPLYQGNLAADPFSVVDGRVVPRGQPSLGPQTCGASAVSSSAP